VPEQAAVPPQSAQQQSQPLTAPCTAGSSLDNVLRVTTTVQEIMTTVNVAESEEENIVAITKIVGVRVHRSLKVIACNANGTWKQRFDLGKQLQDRPPCRCGASLGGTSKTSWEILHPKLWRLSDKLLSGPK
jgi:hypothetical protein